MLARYIVLAIRTFASQSVSSVAGIGAWTMTIVAAIRLSLCAFAPLVFVSQAKPLRAAGEDYASAGADGPIRHIGNATFQDGYRVTEKGGAIGLTIDQTVIFWVEQRSSSQPHWIAERRKRVEHVCGWHEADKSCAVTTDIDHDWADSATCPSLIPALKDLEKVSVPGFSPPNTPRIVSVADSTFVQVTGTPGDKPDRGARITYGAYGGPIADWWWKADRSLKGCWKAETP